MFDLTVKNKTIQYKMKIILFGVTGMLGRYLFEILRKKYEVICILRDDFDIENEKWSNLEDILTKKLQKNDVVVNCAGIIPQKYNHDNFKAYIEFKPFAYQPTEKFMDLSLNNSIIQFSISGTMEIDCLLFSRTDCPPFFSIFKKSTPPL